MHEVIKQGNIVTNGKGKTLVLRDLANETPSALVARLKFAQAADLTFLGSRNVVYELGYAPTLETEHYRARYARGGLAKAIVDRYPNSTWSGGARIADDDDPKEKGDFEIAISTLFTRLSIWQRLERADKLAGLGHYSILLIGAPGAPNTPLPDNLRPEQISYLQPYAEDRAPIKSYDMNTGSERFGLPEFYTVYLGSDAPRGIGTSAVPTVGSVTVHHTRIFHIAEGLLEDDVFGTPRLESVWNYLDDLLKVVGGGSEAAYKRMDPGMQLDLDKEITLTKENERKLQTQVDEYVHGLRRVLQTRGVDLKLLTTQVQGFGPNADAIISLICGTTGIPQRILLGSERGELASTQDRLNWRDRINERRRGFATPIVRQLVDRFIKHGIIPEPTGDPTIEIEKAAAQPAPRTLRVLMHTAGGAKYVIVWPEVGVIDDETKATIIGRIAAANQAQANAKQPPVMTADEIRHAILDLGPLPDEIKKLYAKMIENALNKPAFGVPPPSPDAKPPGPPNTMPPEDPNAEPT